LTSTHNTSRSYGIVYKYQIIRDKYKFIAMVFMSKYDHHIGYIKDVLEMCQIHTFKKPPKFFFLIISMVQRFLYILSVIEWTFEYIRKKNQLSPFETSKN